VLTAVALGASLDAGTADRLDSALAALRRVLADLRTAPLFRGPALGPPQPDIINTVALGRAVDPPELLLAFCKQLELAAGRRPGPRWGPRPLDLDLLFWGDTLRATPELTLPHPALLERRFALLPLAAIDPDLRLPPTGRTVRTALAALGPESAADHLVPWQAPRARASAPVRRGRSRVG
jgi:2-amino-4-hydroxy-6-hydroxymethyldihydropteridine diphosphokinase